MEHIDPEALLAHHGWVRALARTLVRDPAGADDLEQEVWSRALARGPRRGSNLKAWLGTIVRNTAREGWRGERRAAEMRRHFARDASPGQEFGPQRGAEETPAQRQVRMESHMALLSALTELEDPFGSVVYLRFVDELSVKEIAARLGSPEATVRTQLKRGLDRLRERVKGSLGTDWRARVLLLVGPTAKAPIGLLASGGAALMGLKVFVAACVAAAIAAYALGTFDGPTQTTELAGQSGIESLTRDLPVVPIADDPVTAPEERVPVAAAQTVETPPSIGPVVVPAVPSEGGIRVRVLDHVRFEPIAGAEVLAFDMGSPRREEFKRAMSDEQVDIETLLDRFGQRYGVDADGIALLPERKSYIHIAARANSVFVHQYLYGTPTSGQLESIALYPLPQIHVLVRVLDVSGSPVVGQEVQFQQFFSNSIGQRLDHQPTDAAGRAEFRNLQARLHDADWNTSYRIAVPLPGLNVVAARINPKAPPTEEIILRLPALGTAVIHVTDEFGVPAPDGTRVTVQAAAPSHGELLDYSTNAQLGGVTPRTVNGRLETPVQLGQALTASTLDTQSGETTIEYFESPRVAGETVHVNLETRAAPTETRIHVVDSQGQSVHSNGMWGSHVRLAGDRIGEARDRWIETGPAGILDATAPKVLDEDGTPRDDQRGATFLSEDRPGLLRFGWTPWVVGGSAELVLGKELVAAGVVLDDAGLPIANSAISFELAMPWDDDGKSMTFMGCKTDDAGRFTILGELPADPARFSLQSNQPLGGQRVQPRTIAFEPGQDDLVITLRTLPRIFGSLQLDPGLSDLLTLRLGLVDDNATEYNSIDHLGRFDFRAGLDGRAVLCLMASGNREITRSPEFTLQAGKDITPEGWVGLDLRGRLVRHEIEVRAESGTLPAQVVVWMTDFGIGITGPQHAQLVTDEEWVTVSIEAEGFERSAPQGISRRGTITLVPSR